MWNNKMAMVVFSFQFDGNNEWTTVARRVKLGTVIQHTHTTNFFLNIVSNSTSKNMMMAESLNIMFNKFKCILEKKLNNYYY
jgi:hypothetical protein